MASRSGKLVAEVPAYYSLQACAACGDTHSDHWLCQSEFVCQSCNQRDPADHNASAVIAKRGVRCSVFGWCSVVPAFKKMGRKCGILKNKVGEVIPEPVASVPYSLGETEVSRLGGNTQALGSLTQETPATAQA